MKKKPFTLAALALFFLLAMSGAGHAQGIAPTTTLTSAEIDDPLFGGKKAFTVTIPSGWQFQGTVVAGLGLALPSPVFRAYSPDGLTEIRLLPAFQWELMKKSRRQALGVPPETIFLKKTFTASEFLHRYVRAVFGSNDQKAHIVGPMSVGTGYQQQLDKLLTQMNTSAPSNPKIAETTTGSAAALRIKTVNGTFQIEQRLRARVICTRWGKPISGIDGTCAARIDVARTTKGHLDTLVDFADAHNLANAKHEDAWLAAILAHLRNPAAPHFHTPPPNWAARAVLFRQATDLGWAPSSRSKGSAKGSRNIPQYEISDWADYAIDLPASLDPTNIVQQPSTVCTWVSISGERYSTADPQTNPNHVLPGDWTKENTPSVSREELIKMQEPEYVRTRQDTLGYRRTSGCRS